MLGAAGSLYPRMGDRVSGPYFPGDRPVLIPGDARYGAIPYASVQTVKNGDDTISGCGIEWTSPQEVASCAKHQG